MWRLTVTLPGLATPLPNLTGVIKMDFLIRAELYAEAHGDEMRFKNLYTGFREYNGVADSVWKTLSYLYGSRVANLLSEFKL
jgi:hypothetical protein